jgi:hypothetical protein
VKRVKVLKGAANPILECQQWSSVLQEWYIGNQFDRGNAEEIICKTLFKSFQCPQEDQLIAFVEEVDRYLETHYGKRHILIHEPTPEGWALSALRFLEAEGEIVILAVE